MKIFVGNLSYFCGHDELESLFTAYGSVENIHLCKSSSGDTMHFAFITFANNFDGERSITGLNNSLFMGRNICVRHADRTVARQFTSSRMLEGWEVMFSFISHQRDIIVCESSLRQVFSIYGEVLDCVIRSYSCETSIQSTRGLQNGYGFVEFRDKEMAEYVVKNVKSASLVDLNRQTIPLSRSNELPDDAVTAEDTKCNEYSVNMDCSLSRRSISRINEEAKSNDSTSRSDLKSNQNNGAIVDGRSAEKASKRYIRDSTQTTSRPSNLVDNSIMITNESTPLQLLSHHSAATNNSCTLSTAQTLNPGTGYFIPDTQIMTASTYVNLQQSTKSIPNSSYISISPMQFPIHSFQSSLLYPTMSNGHLVPVPSASLMGTHYTSNMRSPPEQLSLDRTSQPSFTNYSEKDTHPSPSSQQYSVVTYPPYHEQLSPSAASTASHQSGQMYQYITDNESTWNIQQHQYYSPHELQLQQESRINHYSHLNTPPSFQLTPPLVQQNNTHVYQQYYPVYYPIPPQLQPMPLHQSSYSISHPQHRTSDISSPSTVHMSSTIFPRGLNIQLPSHQQAPLYSPHPPNSHHSCHHTSQQSQSQYEPR